jgi:hypothetical protein
MNIAEMKEFIRDMKTVSSITDKWFYLLEEDNEAAYDMHQICLMSTTIMMEYKGLLHFKKNKQKV